MQHMVTGGAALAGRAADPSSSLALDSKAKADCRLAAVGERRKRPDVSILDERP
jgi:hypothetical protein